MSAKITVSSAVYSATPGINQTATVKYRVQTDPDVEASYTTVTTTAQITPAGTFSPAVNITGLPNGVAFVVRTINNCNNSTVDKTVTTPLSSCVSILDVTATSSEE